MRTLAAFLLLAATPASAQLVPALPRLGEALPARPLLRDTLDLSDRLVRQLADARVDRLRGLVRAHPDAIALDPQGNPARAHEVVVSDPQEPLIARAVAGGFRVIERETTLGVGFARFETPRGQSLRAAIAALRKLGARDVQADQIHWQSGVVTAVPAAITAQRTSSATPLVGMIDSGVGGNWLVQRGFAAGAPRASAHGSAVASLIAGRGAVRGGAPGARVYAADVYGADPAGGSATAIAKALDWLVGQGAPVVTISLVGPQNPLLARVVAAAQARGVILVAAVGNDGPGAPPAYPASYPDVIAVTGVDARGRVLIEAGRALHLDYAAPGADMLAADAGGGSAKVRGTSFAAPLVAARIAAAYPAIAPGARNRALAQVDAEAERLGNRYGRGLVCRACRTPAP